MKEIEVSAIIPKSLVNPALAITPDGAIWCTYTGAYWVLFSLASEFERGIKVWNACASHRPPKRGIFKIKVEENVCG